MTQVFVSLGSNIDREKHIFSGISALRHLDPNSRTSRIYEAVPVGFSGPNFFNVVVELHLELNLEQTLQALRKIESDFGRDENAIKFQNRTLDIDLLTFGNVVRFSNPLLPRADIFNFAFVLLPLTELAAEQIIPGTQLTYSNAWARFDKIQALWPIAQQPAWVLN